MAITSIGYGNTIVPDTATANWLRRAGMSKYGVDDMTDWRPTIGGAGSRAVTIAAGIGWGHSIVDTNSAPVVVNATSVVSGNRYDTIVARRNWGTGVTSFAVVVGGGTRSITRTNTTPGVIDDQPIAVIRLNSGSSVLDLWDVRVFPAPSMTAIDRLALSYFNDVGTQIRFGAGDGVYETQYNHEIWSSGVVSQWVQSNTTEYPWVDLNAGTGWSKNSGGFAPQVKRSREIATFRGGMYGGTAGNVATTLPAFACPARETWGTCLGTDNTTVVRYRIRTNGWVNFTAPISQDTQFSWSVA